MKRNGLKIVLPLAILIELAGLIATIYGYVVMKRNAAEADAARFQRLIQVQMADINARMRAHESILYGGVGLLNGSVEVNQQEWRNYVQSLELGRIAPGILGVGTITPVPADKRDVMISWFERNRGPDFKYKTVDGAPPPEGLSMIIDRIEPIKVNRAALGLDVGSEDNRRRAYSEARDSGSPRVTGIVTLVQDEQKTPGFLLIVPRYRLGAATDTVEQRREAFLDVVYAPMIGKNLFDLPSSLSSPEVAFSVYDEKEDPERLIFYTEDPRGEGKARYEQIIRWPYAGREWLIHTWTTPSFVSKADSNDQLVFLYSGIALSTLLSWVLYLIHRSHGQALRLMDQFQNEADERARINRLFVEHAPAAIAVFDRDLNYLAASRRWLKEYGCKEDVVGKHHYDVFPEIRGMERWVNIHRRCVSGEHVSCDEDRFERADGSVHYLRWEIHPWQKADGSIGGIIMFSQDITREVEARERLQQTQKDLAIAEERLRHATDAGNIGVWDWRIPEDRLIWNEQMYRLFGVEAGSAPCNLSMFRQSIHPDDLARVEQSLGGAVRDGLDYEIEYRTARGDHPTVLASGQVHRDASGKPVRMLGVCVDVTDQVRMRKELSQALEEHALARREAENAVRAREQFLATMSHELRTPMNGMIGMSELLLQGPLDEQQKECARTIVQCGRSLKALVNDILDLSRIQAGKLVIEQAVYRPVDLLERVLRVVHKQALDKRLKLSQRVHLELPGQILGDENRVQQVLLNLLSNAIKFTPEGGSIELSARSELGEAGKQFLIYEVIDSGMGMSKEDLQRVFQPFVQADSSITRKFGGSGLGLSISRSLVLLMRGSLELESEPGRGTTAIVRLPLRLPELPHAQNGALSIARSDEEDKRLERVLIVEDNPINQRVTELQMKRFARQIVIAADGSKALDLIRDGGSFDLIIMDLQMPVMDGFEATRRIRAIERDMGSRRTPIIALTANVYDEDRRRCFESGMDAFLTKPLQIEVLETELNRLTGPGAGL